MYSSILITKNAKHAGRLVGTHQKVDRLARRLLTRQLPRKAYFPTAKEIINFEGAKGPDGLKRKSPGVDEPKHFVIPEDDDGKLMEMILDHQYNLNKALKDKNNVRAAFEAAWMAHAIADGLTPAHHFPLSDATEELMAEKDFVKLFGTPIKGIMRGEDFMQAARNNWLYWGANGYMSKHVAFEYGVAIIATSLSGKLISPKINKGEFKNLDLKKEFYESLDKIHGINMYNRFIKSGWTAELALEVKNTLLPEVIKIIAIGWYSAIPGVK